MILSYQADNLIDMCLYAIAKQICLILFVLGKS